MLAAIERILPDESFIYLADEANMPYGNKSADEIKSAAFSCAETLFSMNCKAAVVACNTATATAISDIRAQFATRIVVGLEPAVKPCYNELGKNGYALALVTEATHASAKFERLLATCEGKITAIARPELAEMIEKNIHDPTRLRRHVYAILSDYKDAEAVILGCSHYTYITSIIDEFYGGKIKIYDGATGAANRLKYCLAVADMNAQPGHKTETRFYSTVGQRLF